MSDEDMTPEEFDAAMEAGEPVELVVNLNRSPFVVEPARTWAPATTVTLRYHGWPSP